MLRAPPLNSTSPRATAQPLDTTAVAESQNRPSLAHHPTTTCAVCLDEVEQSAAWADGTRMHSCGLCETNVCHACMAQYVHMTVVETGMNRRRRTAAADRFKCPGQHCPAVLPPHVVLQYTSDDDAQLYMDLLHAPVHPPVECPRCEGQSVTLAGRKLSCTSCNVTFCNNCGDPYHLFGCRKDKAFQAWKQHKDVRSCPRCHAAIEKTGGCTHMKCIYCEFDFCWLCRVEWHDHTDVMCKPRAFLTSNSTSLGPTAPVRAVTKAVVVVAALAVVAVGVGVATVLVAPPLLFADSAKTWWRRQKQGKSLKALKERHEHKQRKRDGDGSPD